MDARVDKLEQMPSPETGQNELVLYDCKWAEVGQEEVVKEVFQFFIDRQGAYMYALDGKLIRPEPEALEDGKARYVQAGTGADIDSVQHGGMGVVRKMLDVKLNRNVAAKRADLSYNAILEARILAKFQHPNLVTVYDLAITKTDNPAEREIFFITEWLEGKSLATWNEHPHSLSEIARVANQLTSGLKYMHQLGWVYGDIKPLNIMFDKFGNVKIVDVGLAYKLDSQGKAQGIGFRTFAYAPPEQYSGNLSIQTDVYSLAAVLFETLATEGPSWTKMERDDFLKDESLLVPLKEKFQGSFANRPELHRELSAIFRKALSKKPEDRYSSIQEFNIAFQGILKQLAS